MTLTAIPDGFTAGAHQALYATSWTLGAALIILPALATAAITNRLHLDMRARWVHRRYKAWRTARRLRP